MKLIIKKCLVRLLNICTWVAALYVGIWVMVIQPVYNLFTNLYANTLTGLDIFATAISIIFSLFVFLVIMFTGLGVTAIIIYIYDCIGGDNILWNI